MLIKPLAAILLTLTALNSLDALAGNLASRVNQARQRCLKPRQNGLTVEFKKPPTGMVQHYRASTTQRALFPIYRGIVDEFGSVLQGMISGGDEFAVRPYLHSIARDLKAKQTREGLTSAQTICLVSCVTNILMEPDEDVFPTTSMDMAVADGKGFCRHYMMTTKYMLDRMSIQTRAGFSWDHTFLYFNHGQRKYIFDPTVSDGMSDCAFFSTENL